MSSRDIMPFSSVHGGGIERNVAWQIENNGTAVTATFRIGEFCLMDITNGQIDELGAGSVALDKAIHFLSLEDAVANIRRIGDARYGNTPSPAYPATFAQFSPECDYVTKKVCNNADTNLGPVSGGGSGAMTGVNVGDACGIRVFAAGSHAIDINTTGFRISRLLDSLGRDTFVTGAAVTATEFIVFRPI
jgi:hypothetical protein